MSSPLVVGMGQATVAITGVVSALPDHDSPVEMGEVLVQVGGAAATAVLTAAHLGCRARFCSKVADDFLAPFITDALSRAGVEDRLVRAKEKQLSAFSFEAVSKDQKARHLFSTNGDVASLHESELNTAELLDGASAVLVDGFFPQAQVALAEAARARGIPVIFDYESLRGGVGELVALADVVLASERLASELAPRGELQDSLVELQRMGPRAVILTLGESGSVGLHGEQLVRQPAFPVHVVDTRGSGNVYHGAFVTALLSELPFPRCMEFASAAAALSCKVLGAAAGIPSREEVINLVREAA